MRVRLHDEEGMAMVVAILVTMVLLILSVAVVTQSIHAATSSAYDRARLTSVDAGESGLDYYYAYLQSTPVGSVSCNPVTQTVASAPVVASFTATPTFYDASGNTMPCPTATPFTDSSYPASVLVQSTGTVGGRTPRTMQTFIRLTPVYGGFGAAIMSNAPTALVNNFDVYGNNGNNGDVYILNGDLSISNTPHVRGNVYVPYGGATVSGGSNVSGALDANDNVTIANPASVTGNVISATGSISGSGSIGANATAATTISGVSVAGTTYPNTVSPRPPTQAFPHIMFTATDQANWTNAGYTVCTFTGSAMTCGPYSVPAKSTGCLQAQSFVEGSWTGNFVVRIAGSPCTYNNSNNATVTLGGSLAIITDWGINLSQQSAWNGGASPPRNVYLISTWPSTGCPASGTSNEDVSLGNQTSFDAYSRVFVYTPCTASLNNLNNLYGQVIAGNVTIGNNYTMTYAPVQVPGYGTITSFNEDIAYVREAS